MFAPKFIAPRPPEEAASPARPLSSLVPREAREATPAPTPSEGRVGLSTLGSAYRRPPPPPAFPSPAAPRSSLSQIARHIERAPPPPPAPRPPHTPARAPRPPPAADRSAHLAPLGVLPLLPLPHPFMATRLFRGHVCELLGGPGAGKTELLRRIAVEFAVPRYLGGRGECAVVLDCENRFDMHRVGCLLRERVAYAWHQRFGDGGPDAAGETVAGSPDRKATQRPPGRPSRPATTPKMAKQAPSFAKFMRQMEQERAKAAADGRGTSDPDPKAVMESLARTEDRGQDADAGPPAEELPPVAEGQSAEDAVRKVYFECLDRILLFQPPSPLSALCTVMSLDSFLEAHPNVGCIVLDAVTSFAFLEADTEPRAPGSGGGSGPGAGRRPQPRGDFPRQLAGELRRVLERHPVFVFAASLVLPSWSQRGGKARGLGALVNHTISLERGQGRPQGTLEEMVAAPTTIHGRVRSSGPSSLAHGGNQGADGGDTFAFRVSRSEKLPPRYMVRSIDSTIM